MFGLGVGEIVVILVIALLVIGPEKLPEVAKSLGRGLREIRKVTDDVRDTVNETVNDAVRNVAAKPSPPVPPSNPLPGSGMTTANAVPAPTPDAPKEEPAPAVRAPEDGERIRADREEPA